MVTANVASCFNGGEPNFSFGGGPGVNCGFVVLEEVTIFLKKIECIQGQLSLDLGP